MAVDVAVAGVITVGHENDHDHVYDHHFSSEARPHSNPLYLVSRLWSATLCWQRAGSICGGRRRSADCQVGAHDEEAEKTEAPAPPLTAVPTEAALLAGGWSPSMQAEDEWFGVHQDRVYIARTRTGEIRTPAFP